MAGTSMPPMRTLSIVTAGAAGPGRARLATAPSNAARPDVVDRRDRPGS
jgi:hypothetical protein